MKIVPTILMVAGILLVAVNLYFINHLQVVNGILLVLGGVMAIVGVFMRVRARAGVPPTQVPDGDRSQIQKLRRELSLRELFGRLFGTFAMLFVVTGILSPFFRESGQDWNWAAALGLMMFGVFLLFCAVLLASPESLKTRPPLWLPAVSGFACSCFVLLFLACALVNASLSTAKMPDWLRSITSLALVGCVLSALVCIITGISAFFRRKKEPANPFTPPAA